MGNKHFLILLIFIAWTVSAKEIFNLKSEDGRSKARADYESFPGLFAARGDIKLDQIVKGNALFIAREQGMFTPAYIGVSSSFNVDLGDLGFGCDNVSVGITGTGTDQRLDLKFGYEVDNCYFRWQSTTMNWWENYELLVKISEEELKIDFGRWAGIGVNKVVLIKVGAELGCLFRSGPSNNDPPIARAEAGTYVAFIGDHPTRKAWLRAMVHSEKDGWVEAYAGKRVMEVTTDGEIKKQYKERWPIPPMKDWFN